MSNLWQIDEKILEACIDTETGEIIDEALLEELELEKDAKIENIAKWVRNLEADIDAFKAQKLIFEERIKRAEKKRDSLKKYLGSYLDGAKWNASDGSVLISFRKAVSTNILDEDMVPAEFWKEKVTRTIAKDEIKKAFKEGKEVPGCELIENNNIQIK